MKNPLKNVFLKSGLLFVFLVGLIASAQAKTLSCVQPQAPTMYMNVSAKVEGQFSVYAKRAIFSQIDFAYAIYMDTSSPNSIWSEGAQTFKALANDENYRPRKYKDHMKFNVYVSGIGGRDGFGELDLIAPTKNMLASAPSSFTAYLVLTSMDDHFGGTVPMKCSIQ